MEVTLIRIERPIESTTKRKERVSWFLWHGQEPLPLWEVWSSYQRRYSQEHGYRFDKQCLLWERPRLCIPEQFECWSHVVAIAHNQLVLARLLDQVERRPWERSARACTPRQVRRAMPRILTQVGTPAQPVQLRGKSSGRQARASVTTATCYEVVRKPKPVPKQKRESVS